MTQPGPDTGDTLGDARFFGRSGPYSLAVIARELGIDMADGEGRAFSGVAPLHRAGPQDVSFLHNARYGAALEATHAGAVIIAPDMLERVPPTAQALVVDDPHLGWARVATLFYPPAPAQPGRHPSAVIDDTAEVSASAEIGPLAVIGAGAQIGPGCRIGPHATIGAGVVLGEGCRIGANASVSHAILGKRVYIYPGARIGQDGFGFAITKTGFVTVPQLGRVILHDDVEIGANAAVDRGAAQDTVIGTGTRLDNLVQIGHGVRIGSYCALAAQIGISGSTTVGDFVQIGGQAAFAGHLSIGSGARIGAQSGVIGNVPPGADILGSPALPKRVALLGFALVKRMAEQARGGKTRNTTTQDTKTTDKTISDKDLRA